MNAYAKDINKPQSAIVKRPRKTISIGRIITYIFLTVLAVIWIYPFAWMISSSFKTQSEFFSGLSLIPQNPTFDNFVRAWEEANFSQYFLNTVLVSVCTVAIVLISTSLAGYALGRYDFPGKKTFFLFSLQA